MRKHSPDLNLGVACGLDDTDGLIVLDVDRHKGDG